MDCKNPGGGKGYRFLSSGQPCSGDRGLGRHGQTMVLLKGPDPMCRAPRDLRDRHPMDAWAPGPPLLWQGEASRLAPDSHDLFSEATRPHCAYTAAALTLCLLPHKKLHGPGIVFQCRSPTKSKSQGPGRPKSRPSGCTPFSSGGPLHSVAS